MPLLYFWTGANYKRDLNMGAGYHLSLANPRLHEIKIDDSLWAFTRNIQDQYVLAAVSKPKQRIRQISDMVAIEFGVT
jgi:hypothetical protein